MQEQIPEVLNDLPKSSYLGDGKRVSGVCLSQYLVIYSSHSFYLIMCWLTCNGQMRLCGWKLTTEGIGLPLGTTGSFWKILLSRFNDHQQPESILIWTTEKNRLSEMGFGLAFQWYQQDSEMALGSSDAKKLLTSHRYNCDSMNNNSDIYLTILVLETLQNFMPQRSLNGL